MQHTAYGRFLFLDFSRVIERMENYRNNEVLIVTEGMQVMEKYNKVVIVTKGMQGIENIIKLNKLLPRYLITFETGLIIVS